MVLESFGVHTFCSGKAPSSGQNSKKSLTPSWWGLCSLPKNHTPTLAFSLNLRPSGCGPSGLASAIATARQMTRLEKFLNVGRSADGSPKE